MSLQRGLGFLLGVLPGRFTGWRGGNRNPTFWRFAVDILSSSALVWAASCQTTPTGASSRRSAKLGDFFNSLLNLTGESLRKTKSNPKP